MDHWGFALRQNPDLGARAVDQLLRALASHADTCNISTQEGEAGRSEIQDWLPTAFRPVWAIESLGISKGEATQKLPGENGTLNGDCLYVPHTQHY